MKKRGKEIARLASIIRKLALEEPLPDKNRDHPLIGNFQSSRECHIEPDWLLIYKKQDNELILVRTGTHSDLFK